MALTIFKPLFVILVISSACIPFFAWIIVRNLTSPWNKLVPALTIVLVTVFNTLLIFFFPLNYEVPRAPSPWAKSLVDAIINFGPVAVQILSPRSFVYLLMSNLAMIYLMTLLLIVKSTEFGLLDLFIAVMPSFLQYFLQKRMIWLIIPTSILLGILICVRNDYEKFMLSISTASNSANFIVTRAKNLFDSVRANYLVLIWTRNVRYEVDEEATADFSRRGHVTIRVNAEETTVDEMIPVDSGNDNYEESHTNMNTYLDYGDNDYTGDEHRIANSGETYDGTGRAGGGSDQLRVDGDEACYGVGGGSSSSVDERGLNGFEALTGADCDGDETGEELGVDGDEVYHGVSRARGRVDKPRVDSKEAYYGVGGASSSGVDERGLNGFEDLARGDCDNDETGEELGVNGDGVYHGVSRARGRVDKLPVDSKEAYYRVGGDDSNGLHEQSIDGKEAYHGVVLALDDSGDDEEGVDGDEAYHGVVVAEDFSDDEESGGGTDDEETCDEPGVDGDEAYHGVIGAGGGCDDEESDGGDDDEETSDEPGAHGDEAFHGVVGSGGSGDNKESSDEPDVDEDETYHGIGRAINGVDE